MHLVRAEHNILEPTYTIQVRIYLALEVRSCFWRRLRDRFFFSRAERKTVGRFSRTHCLHCAGCPLIIRWRMAQPKYIYMGVMCVCVLRTRYGGTRNVRCVNISAPSRAFWGCCRRRGRSQRADDGFQCPIARRRRWTLKSGLQN